MQDVARKRVNAAKKAGMLRSSTMMCSTSLSPALRVFSDSSTASKSDIEETYANQAMQMESLKSMNRQYTSKVKSRASRQHTAPATTGSFGFGFGSRAGIAEQETEEKIEKIDEDDDEEEEEEQIQVMNSFLTAARSCSMTNEARTVAFKQQAPPRPSNNSIFSFGGANPFQRPATFSQRTTHPTAHSGFSNRGFSGFGTMGLDHDAEDTYEALDEIVASSANAEEAATTREALEEIEVLLNQLKIEPTDAEELANKFKLFENLQETVSLSRESVLAFWEENKDEFGSSTANATQIMKQLDKGTGIVDNDRVWFVYLMTKQCHNNNLNITRILDQLKKLLTALQEEVECDCPICFEPLNKENRTVLMCSHSTCKTCWRQWNALQNNRATCPLCRNREFAEQLVETERRYTPR